MDIRIFAKCKRIAVAKTAFAFAKWNVDIHAIGLGGGKGIGILADRFPGGFACLGQSIAGPDRQGDPAGFRVHSVWQRVPILMNGFDIQPAACGRCEKTGEPDSSGERSVMGRWNGFRLNFVQSDPDRRFGCIERSKPGEEDSPKFWKGLPGRDVITGVDKISLVRIKKDDRFQLTGRVDLFVRGLSRGWPTIFGGLPPGAACQWWSSR
jgi:hypothetical protein